MMKVSVTNIAGTNFVSNRFIKHVMEYPSLRKALGLVGHANSI
jgi:hypothetical protein